MKTKEQVKRRLKKLAAELERRFRQGEGTYKFGLIAEYEILKWVLK